LRNNVEPGPPVSGPFRIFVVAVKRQHKNDVPRDWVETVRSIDGVVVQEPVTPQRMLVKASSAAIARVRQRMSEYLLVEELIEHETAEPL
jgi:hypothetical protein